MRLSSSVLKIDEGGLFHCVMIVLRKKKRRSGQVEVWKRIKLSGWVYLVFR